MYHYVYYSYEEWGRGYIGKRSSDLDPELDPYMGSFSDSTFSPTSKIILFVGETEEESLEVEVKLHSFFCVDKNPHFANKARQTSVKFSYSRLGEKHTPEAIQSIRESNSRRGVSPETRVKMRESNMGKKRSPETRSRISAGKKGKPWTQARREAYENQLKQNNDSRS